MHHVKNMPALALLLATALVAGERATWAQTTPAGQTKQAATATPDKQAEPAFVPVEIGPANMLKGPDGQALGAIVDHVVDRQNGQIAFVIVQASTPENPQRRTLVPFSRFTWNAKERKLELPLSAAELAKLDEYDPKNLQTLGGAQASKEGAPKEGAPGAEPRKEVVKNVLASEVARGPLTAGGEPFGTIDTLLLDPRRGAIAHVLVARTVPSGSKDFVVVPWQAMKRSDDGRLGLSLSGAELEQAPTVQRGNLAPLSDEKFLAELRAFYKLPPMKGAAG